MHDTDIVSQHYFLFFEARNQFTPKISISLRKRRENYSHFFVNLAHRYRKYDYVSQR